MPRKANPDRLIRYPMSWPAWLADQVAEAANARAQSMADWMRQAAIEKLDRDKVRGEIRKLQGES